MLVVPMQVQAGTFTSLVVLSQTTTATSSGGAITAGTLNCNSATHAVFDLSAIAGVANNTSGTAVSADGVIKMEATLEITWKQTVAGEVPPATLYYSRNLSGTATVQYSFPVPMQGICGVTGKGGSALASGSTYSTGRGPYSSTVPASSVSSYSFTPAWQLIGVDAAGLASYKASSPTFTTANVEAHVGISVFYGTSATGASAQAGGTLADSILFSATPF